MSVTGQSGRFLLSKMTAGRPRKKGGAVTAAPVAHGELASRPDARAQPGDRTSAQAACAGIHKPDRHLLPAIRDSGYLGHAGPCAGPQDRQALPPRHRAPGSLCRPPEKTDALWGGQEASTDQDRVCSPGSKTSGHKNGLRRTALRTAGGQRRRRLALGESPGPAPRMARVTRSGSLAGSAAPRSRSGSQIGSARLRLRRGRISFCAGR